MAFNKIADAFVEIEGDKGAFSRTIKGAKRETTGFARSATGNLKSVAKGLRVMGAAAAIAAIGIATAATALSMKLGRSIVDVTKKAGTLGDEFHKMSLRVGESAGRLSALKFAAEISGSAMSEVELGLRRLSQNMNDFSTGTGEAKKTFEALGIQVIDSNGHLRSSIDVLSDVADGLNELQSESQKTAFAQELFGRSGARLLPLLKEGSKGIKTLTDRAAKLGLVIDDKAAAASAEFNDRLLELTSSMEMVKFKIGSALIPVIQPLIERFTDVASEISAVVGALSKLAPLWKTNQDQMSRMFSNIITIGVEATAILLSEMSLLIIKAAPLVWKPLFFTFKKVMLDIDDAGARLVGKAMRKLGIISEETYLKELKKLKDSNEQITKEMGDAFSASFQKSLNSAIAEARIRIPKAFKAITDGLSQISSELEPLLAGVSEMGTAVASGIASAIKPLIDLNAALTTSVKLTQSLAAFMASKTLGTADNLRILSEAFAVSTTTMSQTARDQWGAYFEGIEEQQRQSIQTMIDTVKPAFENMFAGLIGGETKGLWTAFWQDLRRIAIRELATIFATQLLAGLFTGGASFGGVGVAALGSALTGGSAIPAAVGQRAPSLAGRTPLSIGTMAIYDQDLTNFDIQRMQRHVEQGIGPALARAAADGI